MATRLGLVIVLAAGAAALGGLSTTWTDVAAAADEPTAAAPDGAAASADTPSAEAPPVDTATNAPPAPAVDASAASTPPPPAVDASVTSTPPAPAADAATMNAPTGEVPAGEAPPADGKSNPDFVSDGTRLTVKDGDLTLQPPRGWEVYTHQSGLTLLLQVPFQPGMKYQRTIQVASFSGPRYIDEVTAKEYEELIVRKFSATGVSIEGYRVRNHMNIEMADGREGLLFYTEFTIEGVSLMQAHILVSSAEHHFLLTFTDVAEHFENDAASQFLTEAWDSMISVQLSGRTPARFQSAAVIAVGAGLLMLIALLVLGVRQWRSGQQYRDFADGKDGGMSTTAPVSLTGGSDVQSLHSGHSDVSQLSGVSRLASKHGHGKDKNDKNDKKGQRGKTGRTAAPKTKASSAAVSLAKGTKADTDLQESEADEPFDTQDDVAV